MRYKIAVFGLVFALVGCGSDQDDAGLDARQADADAIPPGCDEYKPSERSPKLSLQDEKRWLPLHELYFQEGAGAESLCKLFVEQTASVVIMQMVSPPCYRCMKWSETIAARLGDGDTGDLVQHVILAIDDGDTSAKEWESIAQDVAPSARWVQDYKNGLWNFFAVDEQERSDPLTVVFSHEGRGFYTLDSTLDFPALKTKIDEILK